MAASTLTGIIANSALSWEAEGESCNQKSVGAV